MASSGHDQSGRTCAPAVPAGANDIDSRLTRPCMATRTERSAWLMVPLWRDLGARTVRRLRDGSVTRAPRYHAPCHVPPEDSLTRDAYASGPVGRVCVCVLLCGGDCASGHGIHFSFLRGEPKSRDRCQSEYTWPGLQGERVRNPAGVRKADPPRRQCRRAPLRKPLASYWLSFSS